MRAERGAAIKHLGMLIVFTLAAGVLTGPACAGRDSGADRIEVQDHAMEPTIPHGALVRALDYRGASPQRGDVIAFRAPPEAFGGTQTDEVFIRRIIAVPGDVVWIERYTGAVEVNGLVLNEPYIDEKSTCFDCGPWRVPERSYFVMGDNRAKSSDSRQGWFVPEERIIGRVQT